MFEGFHFTNFWEDSVYAFEEYVSKPPFDELIASAEQELVHRCINNSELNCQRYPCICPFEWMSCLLFKLCISFLKFFYLFSSKDITIVQFKRMFLFICMFATPLSLFQHAIHTL